ncbi:hypothetical protein Tco_0884103 [Tanacetum coccineum]
MTMSSTNELFTPYKEPEQEFRSSRRHFKTLSLDKLRSSDFNLLYYQEYSEEEEAEAIAETMEQYMSKTRIGSDNEDANEHIMKVLEIVDLFHVPNITVDQLMLRVFPISLTGAKMEEINNFQQEPDETLYQAWERFKEPLMKCLPTKIAKDAKKAIQEMAEYSQKWHNGTSRRRSTETSDGLAAIQAQLNNLGRAIKKVNENVYVAQVGCGGYKATTLGYYQRNNVNPSYQERRQSVEDTLRKFMSELVKRHKENSNLIKEIRATTDAAIRNQGASIKTLEIQIGQMRKVLQERGFGSLPSSTETNLRD